MLSVGLAQVYCHQFVHLPYPLLLLGELTHLQVIQLRYEALHFPLI